MPAYASYAAKIGVAKAMDEFKHYRASQLHCFPSLLLEKEGKERVIVNGFGPRSMTETVDPADRFPTAKDSDGIITRA